MALKPTPSNFFRSKTARTDDEDPRTKRKITSAVRWTDAKLAPIGQRKVRRLRDADTKRTTKKHRRQQVADYQQRVAHHELAAVAVLRHFEESTDLPTGGLRQRLIDDGALAGTVSRIIGFEDVEVEAGHDVLPEGAAVFQSPIFVEVPVGHTPRQILNAAGIDDNKLAELYTDLVEADAA
ncbi:MAG: hypothetical protein H7288_13360 [Kineosporiaceae bacterium]|nr:hypothetical protein [Aeromicrobium sp.]